MPDILFKDSTEFNVKVCSLAEGKILVFPNLITPSFL